MTQLAASFSGMRYCSCQALGPVPLHAYFMCHNEKRNFRISPILCWREGFWGLGRISRAIKQTSMIIALHLSCSTTAAPTTSQKVSKCICTLPMLNLPQKIPFSRDFFFGFVFPSVLLKPGVTFPRVVT